MLKNVALTNGRIEGVHVPLIKIKTSSWEALHFEEEHFAFDKLFNDDLAVTTCQVWVIWSFGYFTFYSIYLAIVLLFQTYQECDYEYENIFLSSAIAIFGLIGAINLVDVAGRSTTQGLFYYTTAAFLILYALLYSDGTSVAYIVCLFLGRTAIAGSFAVM